MANIALRVGNERLTFDPKTETFPGHEAANRLVKREGRDGYRIPDRGLVGSEPRCTGIPRRTFITPREYLILERLSPTPNEFREGQIVPRPPSSRAHSLIVGNITAEIGNQVADRPCEVYAIAMRLLIEATNFFAYPDVTAVVDEPRFLDREVDTLLNPTVLFEVLSESTEAYDRGVKFGHYRRIPSLQRICSGFPGPDACRAVHQAG